MNAANVSRVKVLSSKTIEVVRGLAQFMVGGEADTAAWNAMLDLHCMTNGRSTNILRQVMRGLRPPPETIRPFDSMLGKFDPDRVHKIADKIRCDGYYVFEGKVPEALCDELTSAAMRVEARAGRKSDSSMAVFDPRNPIGHVYDIAEAKCLQIPAFQRLIADPSFINVAQAYFRAAPALRSGFLWWSAVLDGKPDTDAAQLFHFDYDPAPIWLKIFIYLTNVTSTSGPHVFVRGSHRQQQAEAREIVSRHYVRIPDEDIERAFGKDNVVEISGRRGTVVAVDTLGFHKGKAPQTDHRLLAQLVYATPLFVPIASDPMTLTAELDPALARTMKRYPWVFKRYHFSGDHATD
jgi:Phytanoyl-CoA dioxygenase (PhyH)